MSFSKRPKLISHYRNLHSGVTPFQCQMCGRNFRLKYHLKSHPCAHVLHLESPSATAEKGSLANEGSDLASVRHDTIGAGREADSRRAMPVCTMRNSDGRLCNKMFSTRARLVEHLSRAHPGEHYSCGECGERFLRGEEVKEHQLGAHGIQQPLGNSDIVPTANEHLQTVSCRWLSPSGSKCGWIGYRTQLVSHVGNKHINDPRQSSVICRWNGCNMDLTDEAGASWTQPSASAMQFLLTHFRAMHEHKEKTNKPGYNRERNGTSTSDKQLLAVSLHRDHTYSSTPHVPNLGNGELPVRAEAEPVGHDVALEMSGVVVGAVERAQPRAGPSTAQRATSLYAHRGQQRASVAFSANSPIVGAIGQAKSAVRQAGGENVRVCSSTERTSRWAEQQRDEAAKVACDWRSATGRATGCAWRGSLCEIEAHVSTRHGIAKTHFPGPVVCRWTGCGVRFEQSVNLSLHIIQDHAHRDPLVKCKKCEKRLHTLHATAWFHDPEYPERVDRSLFRDEQVGEDERECAWRTDAGWACRWNGDRSHLLSHISSEHYNQDKTHVCRWLSGDKICDSRISSYSFFLGHILQHVPVKRYSCGKCRVRFVLRSEVKEHQAREHPLLLVPGGSSVRESILPEARLAPEDRIRPAVQPYEVVEIEDDANDGEEADRDALIGTVERAGNHEDDAGRNGADVNWPTSVRQLARIRENSAHRAAQLIASRNASTSKASARSNEPQPGPSGRKPRWRTETDTQRMLRECGGVSVEAQQAQLKSLEALNPQVQAQNAKIQARLLTREEMSKKASAPSTSRSPTDAISDGAAVRFSTTPVAEDENLDRTDKRPDGADSPSNPSPKRRRLDSPIDAMDTSEMEEPATADRRAGIFVADDQQRPSTSSSSSVDRSSPGMDEDDDVLYVRNRVKNKIEKKGKGRKRAKPVVKLEPVDGDEETQEPLPKIGEKFQSGWKHWHNDERVLEQLRAVYATREDLTHTEWDMNESDKEAIRYRLDKLGFIEPTAENVAIQVEVERKKAAREPILREENRIAQKLTKQETVTTDINHEHAPAGFPFLTPSDRTLRLIGERDETCGPLEFYDFSEEQTAEMPDYEFINVNEDDEGDEHLQERKEQTRMCEYHCDCDPAVGCVYETCSCMQRSAYRNGRVHLTRDGPQIIVECCENCKCERKNCPSVVQLRSDFKFEAVYLGSQMGFGLRVLESIQRGEALMEFTGLVTTRAEGQDENWAYTTIYGADEAWQKFTGVYDTTRKHLINPLVKGNAARFISHSYDFNVVWMCIYHGGMRTADTRAIVCAAEPLEPGSLAYLNYGKEFGISSCPQAVGRARKRAEETGEPQRIHMCACSQDLCHGPAHYWFMQLTWKQAFEVLKRRELWKRSRMILRESEARGCAADCVGCSAKLRKRQKKNVIVLL